MKFFVIVRVRLAKPFAFWKERFDSHSGARRAAGIHDRFAYPIIGEQAAMYAVATETPRAIHDMIYDEALRPEIEASGFVVGQEIITVCELLD